MDNHLLQLKSGFFDLKQSKDPYHANNPASLLDKNSFVLSEIGDNLSNLVNPNDFSDVSSPINNNQGASFQPQKVVSTLSTGSASIVGGPDKDENLVMRKIKSSQSGYAHAAYAEKKRTMAISLNKLAEQIEGNKRYEKEEKNIQQ